jgi:uncharacterized membrane protein YbhN (UPF0104 family)
MSDPSPASPEARPQLWKSALRVLFSLGLLAGVFFVVDTQILIERISALDLFWVAAALLVTIPQYLLSAARWQLTAKRLGASLSLPTALSEYYLAVLTNQVLPGGVLGDAARAFRHGHSLRRQEHVRTYGAALRAVVFERASGQLVLMFVMLLGLLFWPSPSDGTPFLRVIVVALLVLLIAAGALVFIRRGSSKVSQGGILEEARHALLAPDVLPLQLLYSLSVLATYLICFYCAGRAIGIAMSFAEVIALVPAILFSMTIPLTIAGWGIREMSAAALWGLANLTPADGVAISVAYGIIVLLSALPGALFVFPRARAG